MKVGQHLLSQHKDIDRVKDIHSMPSKSAHRSLNLALIENEGNFVHNINLLKQERDGALRGNEFFVMKRRTKVSNQCNLRIPLVVVVQRQKCNGPRSLSRRKRPLYFERV